MRSERSGTVVVLVTRLSAEKEELEKSIAALDQKTFDALAAFLPDAASERIRETFRGVWSVRL